MAAEEQNRSRSEVIVQAIRDFLQKLESGRMTSALNETYSAPETEEEKAARRATLDLYRRVILENEEW